EISQQIAGALVRCHADIVEAEQQHGTYTDLDIRSRCVERHLIVVEQYLAAEKQIVLVAVEGRKPRRTPIDNTEPAEAKQLPVELVRHTEIDDRDDKAAEQIDKREQRVAALRCDSGEAESGRASET